MILVDTNVLSELMRPSPDEDVLRWIAGQDVSSLFTTSITEAEILHGIQLLAPGKRRTAIEGATAAIFHDDFAGRVLPFDSDAARHYATIAAERRRRGQPISTFDAQIAAIASSRGALLATRNVADFARTGVAVVNPWG